MKTSAVWKSSVPDKLDSDNFPPSKATTSQNKYCGTKIGARYDKDITYSKTRVRQPPLKLTLVVDVKKWLSYKGTCHVIVPL